jgi:hypothetical protein
VQPSGEWLRLQLKNQEPTESGKRQIESEDIMGDKSMEPTSTAIRLLPVTNAPVDENVASIIDVLQEHLKLAREGRLRSVAVVSVSDDGAAIGTQWSCAHGDVAMLIGKLTVLTHDMMAARR